MTVAELHKRMSTAEFIDWAAHDQLSAFEQEQARKEQEMMARVRR